MKKQARSCLFRRKTEVISSTVLLSRMIFKYRRNALLHIFYFVGKKVFVGLFRRDEKKASQSILSSVFFFRCFTPCIFEFDFENRRNALLKGVSFVATKMSIYAKVIYTVTFQPRIAD